MCGVRNLCSIVFFVFIAETFLYPNQIFKNSFNEFFKKVFSQETKKTILHRFLTPHNIVLLYLYFHCLRQRSKQSRHLRIAKYFHQQFGTYSLRYGNLIFFLFLLIQFVCDTCMAQTMKNHIRKTFSINYVLLAGAELTISGFTATYGNWVSVFTAVAMCCFAFSTIIGWGLYGTRCIEFLFGSRVNKPFMLVYALVAIVGATMDLGLMWSIAETFNGLMAIPNLIAVFLLSGVVVKLVKEYFAGEGAKS